MDWNQTFPKTQPPDMPQITHYVASPLWEHLNAHIQATYHVQPKIEHSICSGAPGWNVKYKKSGRSLCVLYPDKGHFTCLVCIGSKEAQQAELILSGCFEYTRDLYWNAKPFNGARWLMIDVTSDAILADTINLISTRVQPKQTKNAKDATA